MSQILVLSFDCLSSPSIILKPPEEQEELMNQNYGRGFSWFNHEELSATVVKESKYSAISPVMSVMQDFSRFYSTIFIGHIRGAAKRLVQQDTQPFVRSYAGRNWLFVHSGDLRSNYANYIPLESDTVFEPIGKTDSEHMFCYLLEKIRKTGARSLAELDDRLIYSWLKEINQLGTMNIALSDGLDILVYQDMNSFNPLYYLRSSPPHNKTHFDTDIFTIDITRPSDVHHTFIIVSNEKLSVDADAMQAAQMLILRRGKITCDSAQIPHIDEKKVNKAGIITEKEKVVKTTPEFGNHHEMQEIQAVEAQKNINRLFDLDKKKYSISHKTIYRYSNPVEMSKHLFHLRPVDDFIQRVINFKMTVSVVGQSGYFEDVFGNIATFYQINVPYTELIIVSDSIVMVQDNPANYSEFLHQRREIPLAWLPWQRQMMSPYLLPPELPESELNELIEFAMSFVKRNDYDLMEVLKDINHTIYQDFEYVAGSTSITATPYDLFISRRGVCQDFANLFICLARLLNIPARYRTGYIYTSSDYNNQIQSEESHAWVELYLPFIGWYGFDPTNGCIVLKNHIRVACGRNYLDASPTSGTLYKGGGNEMLKVYVKVEELS